MDKGELPPAQKSQTPEKYQKPKHKYNTSMAFLTAVTTLAHLAALSVSPSPQYSALIGTNTAISFVWHLGNEQSVLLGIADHGVAVIWYFTDLYYGAETGHVFEVIVLSSVVAVLDAFSVFTGRESYATLHSLWHLISAMKAYYLASLFSSQVI